MRVHHIGYLVKNLVESINVFTKLGYEKCQDNVVDSSREAEFCFLRNEETIVELIAPMEGSKEYQSMAKRIGNGPYHICYIADDFTSDMEMLIEQGYLMIKEPAPAVAIDGRKVAFFFHDPIGIIELLE